METKVRYPQKVDAWLQKTSGCSLIDYCKRFGYYPLVLKVMALKVIFKRDDSGKIHELDQEDEINKDKELKDLFQSFYADKNAMFRKGDDRSLTGYLQDLTAGWVIEDITVEILKYQGIDIVLNGRDKRRQYLIESVTQDPDFRITVGNNTRKVEFSSEINNILERKGFVEKRAPALYRLWAEKCIWLFRDLQRGKYILVDFATEPTILHLREHNTTKTQWTKDVHRYVLAENHKIERDDRLLAAELISVVGCAIGDKETAPLTEIEDEDSPPKTWGKGGKRKTALVQRNIPAPKNHPVKKQVQEPSLAPTREAAKPSSIVSERMPQNAEPKRIVKPTIIEEDDNIDFSGQSLGDEDFV